jgi:predicted DNA-binding transcriptional regulator AlpA
METLFIPNEFDFRRWIKEALNDYFEQNPLKPPAQTDGSEENFLSRKQAAAIFGISMVTLHDWMNKGLPCHKQGGRVFFLRSEVFEYVKTSKRSARKRADPGVFLKMGTYAKTG